LLLQAAPHCASSSLVPVVVASKEQGGTVHQGAVRSLLNPLSCYICRKPYRQLHFFYSHLCPDCAEFNWSKRQEKADLSGMYVDPANRSPECHSFPLGMLSSLAVGRRSATNAA
jgi:hypothetical protein